MSRTDAPADPVSPTPGAALCAFAVAQLDRCLAQLARSGRAHHAGIHQARKSLRRTRAALALTDGRLGVRAERLDRRLKQECRSLSELRDAQAVLDTLARARATMPTAARRMLRTELDAVRSALQARRDALLAERLARDPEFESLRDRVVGCRIQLESLPWERVGEADIMSALKRSARRVRRAADSARRSGESEELHRWRRRLRRVGQQLNALASAGLGQDDAVSPKPTQLDQLAWRQDLRVLLVAVSTLESIDPTQRHAVEAAVRAVANLSAAS